MQDSDWKAGGPSAGVKLWIENDQNNISLRTFRFMHIYVLVNKVMNIVDLVSAWATKLTILMTKYIK